MAIGTKSDFKIYDEYFQAGAFESLTQVSDIFNENSGGAIKLVTAKRIGEFEREAFFKKISGAVTRRDTTSVAAVTDIAMTQDETVGVKVDRKFGPIAQAISAFRKIGMDDKKMSFVLGQMFGQHKAEDMANSALRAVEAAITNVANLNVDLTGATPDTCTHQNLVKGWAPMGDRAGRLKALIMHSKPYLDLVGQSMTDKIINVADVTIYKGTVATFGRPVIVTDSAVLNEGGSPAVYPVLWLVESAVTVTESEEQEVLLEKVGGLENIAVRMQGEYAYTLGVKGAKYVVGSGANPNDAAVGLSTNWTKVASDDKDCAGTRILFN